MSEINDLLKKIAKLENKVTHYKNEQSHYEQQLLDKEVTIQSNTTRIGSLLVEVTDLQRELSNERRHIDHLQQNYAKEKETLQRAAKLASERYSVLKAQHKTAENEKEAVDHELCTLVKENKQLKAEVQLLQERLIQKDTEIVGLDLEDDAPFNNSDLDEEEASFEEDTASEFESVYSEAVSDEEYRDTLAEEIQESMTHSHKIAIKRLEFSNKILIRQNKKLLQQLKQHGFQAKLRSTSCPHNRGSSQGPRNDCKSDLLVKRSVSTQVTAGRAPRVLEYRPQEPEFWWFVTGRVPTLHFLDILLFDRRNKIRYHDLLCIGNKANNSSCLYLL